MRLICWLLLRERPPLTLVHNFGRNDAMLQASHSGQFIWQYDLWKTVLRRCFCQKFKLAYPTYKDVTCCDEWLSFANFLEWVNQSVEVACPSHKYYRLRQMCNSGCLYTTKRSDTMLTVQLPSKLLESAKRVIILTYLFKGNILDSFLKLKGFESVPFGEPLTLQSICGKKMRELLVIDQPPKNFKLRNKLTYSWYMNPMKGDLGIVKNAIVRTCKNWGVSADNVLYTYPKYRSALSQAKCEKIKPAGYTLNSGGYCWLAASTRATNNHAHVTHMIHAYNRHTNVAVASYLQDWDCPVKTDVFALSEMIQWLWRGCIRNGEVMHVCVFSSRMEKLLRDWLEGLPEGNSV